MMINNYKYIFKICLIYFLFLFPFKINIKFNVINYNALKHVIKFYIFYYQF